jgi:hypothetical protein
MALSAPEDNMELATSPFQRVEDLDIDFDDFEDQEIHEMPQDIVDDVLQEDEDLVEGMMEDEQIDQDNNMLAEDPDVNFDVEHQDSDMNQPEQAYDQDAGPSLNDQEDADLLFEEDEGADMQPSHWGDAQLDASSTVHANEQQLALEPTNKEGVSAEQENADADGASLVDELNDITGEGVSSSADAAQTISDAAETGSGLAQDSAVAAQASESGDIPEAKDEAQADAIEVSANDEVNEAHTVEDSAIQAALQAIRVEWTESLYPLFVSEGETLPCFLYDTAVAYEPLDKLLADCRTAIQSEMGENDELILEVDALGLHVSEDSKYASQLTLAQIVEVYLYLNRNETHDDVLPLPCRLTSRVCLETQYKYLMREATQHGRTFSSIVEENAPSPIEAEDDDASQVQADADDNLDDSTAAEINSNNQPVGTKLDSAPLISSEAATVDVTAQALGGEDPATVPASEVVTTVTETVIESTEEPASNEVVLETTVESVIQQDALNHEDDTFEEAEVATFDDAQEHGLLEETLDEYAPDDRRANDDIEEVDAHGFDADALDDQAEPVLDDTEAVPSEPQASVTDHAVEDTTREHLEASLDEDLYGVYDDDNSSHTVEPEGPFDQHNATKLSKVADDTENNDLGLEHNADGIADYGETYDGVTEDVLAADFEASDPSDTATNGNGVGHLAAPPITPSKISPSKRKIEVDDDDLLDFGNETPEPKRRRPS